MLLLQVAGAAVLVAVVAVLLTKGTVALTSRLGGERVSRLIADAEYIVERHAVPPTWQAKLAKKLPGLRSEGIEPRIRTRHQNRARRSCLRELGRLLVFAKTTSIVADEEAREILLSELTQVEAEWRSQSWDAMSAPGKEGAAAHP